MTEVKLTAKQLSKINRAIKSLNSVRKEIQAENPGDDINWYLEDNDNLNLMSENSHDDNYKANNDAVIKCFQLDKSAGGGW